MLCSPRCTWFISCPRCFSSALFPGRYDHSAVLVAPRCVGARGFRHQTGRRSLFSSTRPSVCLKEPENNSSGATCQRELRHGNRSTVGVVAAVPRLTGGALPLERTGWREGAVSWRFRTTLHRTGQLPHQGDKKKSAQTVPETVLIVLQRDLCRRPRPRLSAPLSRPTARRRPELSRESREYRASW